jgi:hypothetical protein
MAKDQPTLTLKVEAGHLVPATPFDLELLDQNWTDGAVLNVEVKRTIERPTEKKYFAQLTALLRDYDTPWTDVLAAHEAIKKKLGFVTPIQRANGQWASQSRRLSSFSDKELERFHGKFTDMVARDYGVDVLSLRSSNTESESSGAVEAAATTADAVDDDGPGTEAIPLGAGEPSGPTHPGPEADGSTKTPRGEPSAKGDLPQADLDWLKQTARMLYCAVGDDPEIIERQWAAIQKHLTPPQVTKRAFEIGQRIYLMCWQGEPNPTMIAALAGCEVQDLRPGAR